MWCMAVGRSSRVAGQKWCFPDVRRLKGGDMEMVQFTFLKHLFDRKIDVQGRCWWHAGPKWTTYTVFFTFRDVWSVWSDKRPNEARWLNDWGIINEKRMTVQYDVNGSDKDRSFRRQTSPFQAMRPRKLSKWGMRKVRTWWGVRRRPWLEQEPPRDRRFCWYFPFTNRVFLGTLFWPTVFIYTLDNLDTRSTGAASFM